MVTKLANVSIYLKPGQLAVLRAHARASNRSLSSFIALHLAEHFKERPKANGREPAARGAEHRA